MMFVTVLAVVLVLLDFCNGIDGSATSATGSAAAAVHKKKNVLLLITDDQDVLIGGIDHMPILHKLLVEQGAIFPNAFVHTPICCPSRSSILTGKYLHNGGATNNSLAGNCHGRQWRESAEKQSFGVLAQKYGGYMTGYVGKYLNQYGRCEADEPKECGHRVPPGWTMWQGLIGNSRYYNYTTIERST
jgi:N-acetylglucosamine-6-sulfatase